MVRVFILVLSFFCSCLSQANEAPLLYQVDLIIFTHQHTHPIPAEPSRTASLIATNPQAVSLYATMSKELTPYHLLPPSFSQLGEEYRALQRESQYHVLLHCTWLQPFNNQRAITLPTIHTDGWQLEGLLKIQRTNYYLLNSELVFSPTDGSQTPFTFAQKQRLKGGDTYYFDHPQAGMLIKVHQLT